jgi:hypothetical protein
MKYRLAAVALFLVGLFCLAQQPHGQSLGGMGGVSPGGFGRAAAYQGPGDVVSGAIAWGSCARAYNATYANGTNSLCDLVAVTGGAAVCTLRVAGTGFVDLAASYCAGTTPSAACAAASGGSCKVTKLYDQISGINFVDVTLSTMPGLVFNSLGGLPGFTCVSANSVRLITGSNITQAQPLCMSAVYERTSGTVQGGVLGGGTSVTSIGGGIGANQAFMSAGTPITQAANDNAYHALQAVLNGASGAMQTDGTDITSQNAGSGGFSAEPLRTCRNSSAQGFDGTIMEVGLWNAAFTLTQRNNLNTNQHGSTYGYNF